MRQNLVLPHTHSGAVDVLPGRRLMCSCDAAFSVMRSGMFTPLVKQTFALLVIATLAIHAVGLS